MMSPSLLPNRDVVGACVDGSDGDKQLRLLPTEDVNGDVGNLLLCNWNAGDAAAVSASKGMMVDLILKVKKAEGWCWGRGLIYPLFNSATSYYPLN
jgi:hypothetical protein